MNQDSLKYTHIITETSANYEGLALRVSCKAKGLIDRGFMGNGCGSGFLSRSACSLFMMALPGKYVEVVKKLAIVWRIHDAEYSLSRTLKNKFHRVKVDGFLQLNIDQVLHNCNIDAPNFAKMLHVALTLKGESSYWK